RPALHARGLAQGADARPAAPRLPAHTARAGGAAPRELPPHARRGLRTLRRGREGLRRRSRRVRGAGGRVQPGRPPHPPRAGAVAMRVLQVVTRQGGVRLAVLDASRARVLTRPHAGLATSLDLLLAAEAGRADLAAWARDAEAAGAFEDVAWEDLS